MTQRTRRNPFEDRARRRIAGSGRPRFTLRPMAAVAEVQRRRNPRAELARITVEGPAGRPRLVRGGQGGSTALRSPAQRVAQRIRVETPAMLVLAVPDLAEGRLSRFDRQILGAARLIADTAQGGVCVLCPPGLDEQAQTMLGDAGADRLCILPTDPADPERFASDIVAWVKQSGAAHLLLPESPDGADLARRVVAEGAFDFLGGIQAFSTRNVIAPCRASRRERVLTTLPIVMTLEEDRAAPYAGVAHDICQVDHVADTGAVGRVRLGAAMAADPASLPLAEAPFVAAAGNGVTDFTAFAAMVRALGATPGASRVVCDAGLMPRATQVGASGTVLDAVCYLAMGISGAPQHLQGIGRVEHIVAVNTDLHAAMIGRAGLAIIADAQEVMPALTDLLNQKGSNA
ncbi:FAD-binding protein [Acetobacter sp. TBRC 12305]|uniref:Electron transfer flavoprotein subunit alpha/FixB family protein n=1 Tax=Acetobacter garciniae TaxID=2817435 RepID=A0A939HMS0_9PROT|nr:FAD-binding protein [Acetobacter garciniae]MBO1325011.1 electron transfer flavoprotein subunit alpha/FixB family protein [Acetobacter garciniae]MBX0344702.1 FAD-binding protein [Acetobacter garciniae]